MAQEGKEGKKEEGRISDFQGLVSCDLDRDLGSCHTAYRHALLVDDYLHTKFH